MSTILHMQGVTRTFGHFVAVLDIDLRLEAGIYGLLGPNGAGKTTLMRLAAGLIRPTGGSVTWLDGHPRRHRAMDNAIAVCLDGEQLPASETPLQLLTFLLRCAGVASDSAGAHAERTLLEFGLDEQLDRPIGKLSRGQRQRVKLAQAMALPARLLLLDEPLNALDPVWRMRVTDRIKAAARDGACVVMSSHVLAEVESIADRMVLMFKGRIVAAGTRLQIHELVNNRGAGLTIRCDQPRVLAAAIMAQGAADSTRIEGELLHIESGDVPTLCRALPAAVLTSAVTVHEVRADGDDLVGMFTALSQQVR